MKKKFSRNIIGYGSKKFKIDTKWIPKVSLHKSLVNLLNYRERINSEKK